MLRGLCVRVMIQARPPYKIKIFLFFKKKMERDTTGHVLAKLETGPDDKADTSASEGKMKHAEDLRSVIPHFADAGWPAGPGPLQFRVSLFPSVPRIQISFFLSVVV